MNQAGRSANTSCELATGCLATSTWRVWVSETRYLLACREHAMGGSAANRERIRLRG